MQIRSRSDSVPQGLVDRGGVRRRAKMKRMITMLLVSAAPPAEGLPAHLTPEAKMTQQLRFIFIGAKHWRGLGQGRD